MRTSLILTVIGDDKPGIVEQLSERILETGANWEESRMARLAGKFAGLLQVSVDAARADALEASLRALAPAGLTVVVERSTQSHPAEARTIVLDLIGHDHPGIIRDIARVLAQYQINIEELETGVTSAAMTGEPLFRARASLRVPPGVTVARLRAILEALAGELMVDLTLGEPEGA
ncbi:MAG: ACT domain-containing protein [Acidimicrobiia bacterium]|nr:ACT domain-containing protein [Acidimicrobiia bacterium]